MQAVLGIYTACLPVSSAQLWQLRAVPLLKGRPTYPVVRLRFGCHLHLTVITKMQSVCVYKPIGYICLHRPDEHAVYVEIFTVNLISRTS